MLLADEINRTTPRTQSALLEAMAEGQVTVEGETRALPEPFFVIATQNPIHQSGTYPLPESQLDRFLMRLELGYPHPKAEREMFLRPQATRRITVGLGRHQREQLAIIRSAVAEVQASENLLDYLQRLVAYTRQSPEFAVGLSPRGAHGTAGLRQHLGGHAQPWARGTGGPADGAASGGRRTAWYPVATTPGMATRWWRCCSAMWTSSDPDGKRYGRSKRSDGVAGIGQRLRSGFASG